jgi:hypothetical protein
MQIEIGIKINIIKEMNTTAETIAASSAMISENKI